MTGRRKQHTNVCGLQCLVNLPAQMFDTEDYMTVVIKYLLAQNNLL